MTKYRAKYEGDVTHIFSIEGEADIEKAYIHCRCSWGLEKFLELEEYGYVTYEVTIVDGYTDEVRLEGKVEVSEICNYIDDGCIINFKNEEDEKEFFGALKPFK